MLAYIAGFLAAILYVSKNTVSKKVSFTIDSRTSTFASFAFALPFYFILLLVLYLFNLEHFIYSEKFWWLVLARAIVDIGAESFRMLAFAHAELSIVECFFAINPIILLIISPFITGDKITTGAVIGIFSIVIATLILSTGKSSSNIIQQKKGIFYIIIAAFFFAGNQAIDRVAVQEGSAVFSGFAMTLLSSLIIAPFVIFSPTRRAMCKSEAKPLLLRGFFETAFMSLKLLALQYLSAPVLVCILRSSLILSVVSGNLVFNEKGFLKKLIAAIVVLIGVICMMLIHN